MIVNKDNDAFAGQRTPATASARLKLSEHPPGI
jgi:hypothetical protein